MCSTSMTSASSSSVVPLAGVLVEQGAYGVGDLAAAAVPDGDVDQHARRRRGSASSAALSCSAVAAGSRSSAPTGCSRQRCWSASEATASSMISSSGSSSSRGTVEVVGREQPQRDDLDADLLAPAEQRLDVGGAGAVPVGGVAADGLGPAAVAVEHHADVLGEPVGGHPAQHPGLVRRVEHPPEPALPVRHALDATGADVRPAVDVTFTAVVAIA